MANLTTVTGDILVDELGNTLVDDIPVGDQSVLPSKFTDADTFFAAAIVGGAGPTVVYRYVAFSMTLLLAILWPSGM